MMLYGEYFGEKYFWGRVLIASGENRHYGSGDFRQFQSKQNGQSFFMCAILEPSTAQGKEQNEEYRIQRRNTRLVDRATGKTFKVYLFSEDCRTASKVVHTTPPAYPSV